MILIYYGVFQISYDVFYSFCTYKLIFMLILFSLFYRFQLFFKIFISLLVTQSIKLIKFKRALTYYKNIPLTYNSVLF